MNRHESTSAPHKPSASWFELFYDLIIVAVVAQAGKVFLSAPTWMMTGLIFAALLTLFTVWLLATVSHSVVPVNDPLRRAILLVQMILLALAALALGPDGLPNWIGFAAISGALVALTAVFLRNARQAPALRRPLLSIAISTGAGAVVFAASTALPNSLDDTQTLLLASLLLLLGCLVTLVPVLGRTLRDLARDDALDLPHLEERCALFVIIVLGESFVGLLLNLGRLGTIPNPGYFVLTFVVAFSMWAVYFNSVLPSKMPTSGVGIRGWILGHALLVMSTVAMAVQFTDLTLSGDPNKGLEYSGHWTPMPLLGIAVALAALAIMAQGVPRVLRAVQAATAIVLALLVVADIVVSPAEIGVTGDFFTTLGAVVLIGDSLACAMLRMRMDQRQSDQSPGLRADAVGE